MPYLDNPPNGIKPLIEFEIFEDLCGEKIYHWLYERGIEGIDYSRSRDCAYIGDDEINKEVLVVIGGKTAYNFTKQQFNNWCEVINEDAIEKL